MPHSPARHQWRQLGGIGAVVAAFAVIVTSAPSAEAQVVRPRGSRSIADITAVALPSVVNISTTKQVAPRRRPVDLDPWFNSPSAPRGRRTRKRYAKGLGSGVIVSRKGYILTNNHVIRNGSSITVALSDGRKFSATIVGADPKSDLAVLKLQGNFGTLKPVTFGRSSTLRLGEIVIAIGNPFGVGQTVTMGIVSAKGRGNMGLADYEDFIQTDAAINPGNSGGALINMRGELVGINTAILSRSGGYQGIGFAIPSDMIRPIMRQLMKHGRVVRGWLGVTIQSIDQDLARGLGLGGARGVLVSDVVPGSPAQRAGLRRRDIVLSVNGRPTRSSRELRNYIALAGTGKTVRVEIIRAGKRSIVDVALTALPTRPRTSRRARTRPAMQATGGMVVRRLDARTRRRFNLPPGLRTGVVITNLAPRSNAVAVGLQPGDVVLEVNRRRLRTTRQFRAAYRASGRTVVLLLYRDGATVYVPLPK